MPKAKLYQVEVIAFDDSSAPKGVGFRMKSSLKNGKGYLEFYKTNNGMHGDEFYLIEFSLTDDTKHPARDLKFVSDLAHVVWTKITNDPNECLNSWPGNSYSEFQAISVPTSDSLIVLNLDSQQQLFAFALNFVSGLDSDSDPANFITYDPIGENRNGGVRNQSAAAIIIAGLAIAGVVAGVAAINGAW